MENRLLIVETLQKCKLLAHIKMPGSVQMQSSQFNESQKMLRSLVIARENNQKI